MTRAPRVLIIRYHRFDDPHVRREAFALRDAGYDVEVVCVATPERRGVTHEEGVTVRNVRVPKTRGALGQYAIEYSVWFAVCFATMTLACLRGRRHDVIQVTSLPDQQVFSTVVPKLLGSRVVIFFKEPTAELISTKFSGSTARALEAWSRFVARWAIRFADQSIAVTDLHRSTYLADGADADRIGVVVNCPMEDHVTPATPDPIDPERVVVMCHGTMERRMGQTFLVEAFDLARRQRPELLLVLCGGGSDEPVLRSMITELGLDDHVDFRGFVDTAELSSIMARADIGVVPMQPSPYSHLVHTTKMYEFMMRGVPVVAGDLAATTADFPDACRYHAAGDATALAATLIDLCDDPGARAEVAARGSAAVASTTWGIVAPHYVSLVMGTSEVDPAPKSAQVSP